MNNPPDRNILFGLLAYQLHFVSHDQLVLVLSNWVQDKTSHIGEVLVKQQVLSTEQYRLLEALVQAHLDNHRGDIALSLEQLSTLDQKTALVISQINDSSLQQTMQYVFERKANSEHSSRTLIDKSGDLRYRILRPHRRGGLGEVFIAQDRELAREVALKEIQERHANDEESRLRFLREAEITGRLEHPGIVPVYGLGTYDNGRPYYAMRFIRGDNLQDALERFHHAAESHPGVSYRSGELAASYRDLLGRFIDVCQAIHYAHSRGVLHRDLKPGNIMLGEYGETLVVDWGLAKVLASSDSDVASTLNEPLQPSISGDSAPTMLGIAVGTPAYMSPEQAAGEIHRLGPATDVYSLGATLYHILVGTPPFTGHREIAAHLCAVKEGTFVRPRAANERVDPAIEAICLKAMALEPANRYVSPLALAKDIESYLADEVISAYQEPWFVRWQRWARAHPALLTGIVASLLLGSVATTVISVLVGKHAQQIELKSNQIAQQNVEINQKRIEAEMARDAAKATTDFMVKAFRNSDPSIDGAQVTVAEILRQAELDLNSKSEIDDVQRADMLHAVGRSYLGLGLSTDALRAFDAALAIQNATLGPTHRDSLLTQSNRGVAFIYAESPKQAINLYQTILDDMKITLGPLDSDTLKAQNNLAMALAEDGQYSEARRLYEETLEAQTQQLGLEHVDTLNTLSNLAQSYEREGDYDKAISLIERVLKLRKEILGDDHPETLTSYGNLANAFEHAGQLERSIDLLTESLEARKSKLGPTHPDTLSTQNNLASAFHAALLYDEALKLYLDSLRIKEERLHADHPSITRSKNNLAILYGDMGRLDLAIDMHEQLVQQAMRTLGPKHPDTLFRVNNLAMAYVESERFDLAIPLLETNLSERTLLLGSDNLEVSTSQNNLASAYSSIGRLSDAVKLYETSLSTVKGKFGENHPMTLQVQSNLGAALFESDRVDEAISILESSLEARKTHLSPNHPDTLANKVSLAAAYGAKGRLEQSILLFLEALDAMKATIGAEHQETLDLRSRIVDAYIESGDMVNAKLLLNELEINIRKKHAPDTLEIALDLAQVSLQWIAMADYDQASEIAQEVLRIRQREIPDSWLVYNTMSVLGEIRVKQSKLEEGKELLLEGFNGLKQRRHLIAPDTRFRVVDAVDRLIDLAETTGNDAERDQFVRERNDLENQ